MIVVTRILVAVYGLLFGVMGLGFWLAPDRLGARLGVSAIDVAGVSTLRGDFGGAFLLLSALCLFGLWRRSRVLLGLGAALLSLIVAGRLLSWAATGDPRGPGSQSANRAGRRPVAGAPRPRRRRRLGAPAALARRGGVCPDRGGCRSRRRGGAEHPRRPGPPADHLRTPGRGQGHGPADEGRRPSAGPLRHLRAAAQHAPRQGLRGGDRRRAHLHRRCGAGVRREPDAVGAAAEPGRRRAADSFPFRSHRRSGRAQPADLGPGSAWPAGRLWWPRRRARRRRLQRGLRPGPGLPDRAPHGAADAAADLAAPGAPHRHAGRGRRAHRGPCSTGTGSGSPRSRPTTTRSVRPTPTVSTTRAARWSSPATRPPIRA